MCLHAEGYAPVVLHYYSKRSCMLQIQHHNGFLNDIHADLQSDERYNQQFSIIDDDSNEVLPEEVKESDCIIGNSDRLILATIMDGVVIIIRKKSYSYMYTFMVIISS